MVPWLVGTWLRVHQLPTQMLVDDEWHMVHALREAAPLSWIVTNFGIYDHSTGMTLCAWMLMRLTPVDEMGLRAPAILAGLLLPLVLPLLLRRFVGGGVAVVLAWLLAVSPLLCFFSRLARPYAVTTLLVGIAVASFYRWFVAGGRDVGARRLYLASAALAPLFHLATLPALLAPFGVVGLARWMPPPVAPPPTREVGRLLGLTLVAMTAVLLAPLVGSGASVLARVQVDRMQLATIPGLLDLLAGTGSRAGVALIGLLAATGAVVLGRRDRFLTAFLALVIGVQGLAVVASGAAAIHVPLVAARYLAVVLPFGLVFPAAGLAALARGSRLMGHAVAIGAAVGLLAIGPLGWIDAVPNDFTNHMAYQADYVPGRYFERFRPHTIPAFYTDVLARRPAATVTIVEAPWHYYFHDLSYLQRVHRQHVLVGFVGAADGAVRDGELRPAEPGLALRRAVHLGDRDALRARRVDFVVLHRDVTAELRWPTGVHEPPIDMRQWEARYREWFGAPVFADAQIVVFTPDR